MTVPAFDPAAAGPTYLYVAVADHIAARVDAGELERGALLPNERELADEYGVSVRTARRAKEHLRERGLLVSLHRKGTFIAPARD